VGFGLIVAGAVTIAGLTLAALLSRESIGHRLFIGARRAVGRPTPSRCARRISTGCIARPSPPSPR
jgi:hypothetical protein